MKVGSDNIKKYRLERDDRQGIACHTVVETSIKFVLGIEFKRANDATCSESLRSIKVFL